MPGHENFGVCLNNVQYFTSTVKSEFPARKIVLYWKTLWFYHLSLVSLCIIIKYVWNFWTQIFNIFTLLYFKPPAPSKLFLSSPLCLSYSLIVANQEKYSLLLLQKFKKCATCKTYSTQNVHLTKNLFWQNMVIIPHTNAPLRKHN